MCVCENSAQAMPSPRSTVVEKEGGFGVVRVSRLEVGRCARIKELLRRDERGTIVVFV